jgi:hypothetical protein
MVPDFPFGFLFGPCCKQHDDCYDDCNNKPTKQTCDDDFYACMVGKCQNLHMGFIVSGWCAQLAGTYVGYVDKNGDGAFDRARKKCC